EYAPIGLVKAVEIAGQVVGADGKPVANADILTGKSATGWDYYSTKTNADADGRFVIKNVPLDDSIAPLVRLGRAVNIPETLAAKDVIGQITIKIDEGNASTVVGRVEDAKGRTLAGAKVVFSQWVRGVGREKNTA